MHEMRSLSLGDGAKHSRRWVDLSVAAAHELDAIYDKDQLLLGVAYACRAEDKTAQHGVKAAATSHRGWAAIRCGWTTAGGNSKRVRGTFAGKGAVKRHRAANPGSGWRSIERGN